jgi:hypothetical protein
MGYYGLKAPWEPDYRVYRSVDDPKTKSAVFSSVVKSSILDICGLLGCFTSDPKMCSDMLRLSTYLAGPYSNASTFGAVLSEGRDIAIAYGECYFPSRVLQERFRVCQACVDKGPQAVFYAAMTRATRLRFACLLVKYFLLKS